MPHSGGHYYPAERKHWAEFFWVHFALIPDGYPPGI